MALGRCMIQCPVCESLDTRHFLCVDARDYRRCAECAATFLHPAQLPSDDPIVLADTYDFISCTEVVEHFHRPADEFRRPDRLLASGGWLAVMTCLQTDDTRFANWHYRRDPTHVVFYREVTFQRLARHHGWSCAFPDTNVCLMRKPAE